MADEPSANEPRRWVLALAVAMIAAAVFATALAGPWIYDDRTLIADNPFIQSFHWWPRWFTTDFWHVNEELVRFGNRMVYWRPAITASYALDWKLGGGSTLMFHVTNTLAQGLVGALAYTTLRRWIGSTWPALIAALLFSVHPTKAESVAWIAGRTDVFCIIGIFVAAAGVARRLRARRGGLALEIAGTAFAYLTKEQAIVIPVFVAVEVWVAADRPALDLALLKKVGRAAWPQVLVMVVYFIARALWMPIRAANMPEAPLRLGDHVQAVLESFGRFGELTVAPYQMSIQRALVHYDTTRSLLHSTPYVIAGALILAGGAVLGWRTRRRWPWIGVALALYFVTLAPTANLVYTQMATLVSERFLYLPVLGIAMIAGMVLANVPARRRAFAYALAGSAVLALSVQSLRRSADYADEVGFWERELAMHPDSREAYNALLSVAVHAKDYPRALEVLLALNGISGAERQAGIALTPGGELDRVYQIALIAGRLARDNDPTTLRAIDAYATELLAGDEAHLTTKFLTLTYPKRTSTLTLLDSKGFRGRLLVLRAELHNRLADDATAVDLAQQALQICDSCPAVATGAALALARAGRYVESFEELDKLAAAGASDAVKLTRAVIDRAYAAHEQAGSASGPKQLQLTATELATLELWGRAYAILAPHLADIKPVPALALGVAELAFRAGETGVARDLLAAHPPPEGIDATLAAWTAEMGWAR